MIDFYGLILSPSSKYHHFLNVESRLTVTGPSATFLFGGAALGACVSAAERSTNRKAVWANAHYLSFAPKGANVEIEIVPVAEGRYTTQARAIARLDGKEIIGASLSLGARPGHPQRQFAQPEKIPSPEECPPQPKRWQVTPGDIYSHFELRVAKGWDSENGQAGKVSLWIRPLNNVQIDRPLLALVGDFVAGAIGNILGSEAGDHSVSSLDNTIRFLEPVETEWIQCDITLDGSADGFGHGRMSLFCQQGKLMASASQSVLVRTTLYPRK